MEEFGRYDFRARFVRLIVVRRKVLFQAPKNSLASQHPEDHLWPPYRMRQSLFDCDSLPRIKSQTFLHEVDSERLCVRVHLRVLLLLFEGQGAQIVSGAVGIDLVEVVKGGRAEYVQNESELVVVYVMSMVSAGLLLGKRQAPALTVSAWKERFSGEHLGQNTSDRPAEAMSDVNYHQSRLSYFSILDLHVNGFRVLFESQHDFRSPIPSSSHILPSRPMLQRSPRTFR